MTGRRDGHLPIGYVPDDDGLETSGQLLESCIGCAGGFALVISAGWLGYLGTGAFFDWITR